MKQTNCSCFFDVLRKDDGYWVYWEKVLSMKLPGRRNEEGLKEYLEAVRERMYSSG